MPRLIAALVLLGAIVRAGAAESPSPFTPPKCQVIPLAGHRVSMQIDGVEKLRWNKGLDYPRPFFFPFNGPSGTSLTRMGHPGAENHDHHQSIWFAHMKVDGVDFWANKRPGKEVGFIRQKHWLVYDDGADEAIMAARLGWFAADGRELMEQDLIAALIPMPEGEHALDIQIEMRPPRPKTAVQLDKTNFGFLAVRVAKTISAHFGGGVISNSEGSLDEANVFGKPARWMDYSGPVVHGSGARRGVSTEGVTYFDHPSNPRHPVKWHVREDGWMGASFCMDEGCEIEAEKPLTLRYLLQAHRGAYNQAKAERVFESFSKRPGFVVQRSKRKRRQYEVGRAAPK